MSHSLNSPSSFARRRACPGSARMEAVIPDEENVHAVRGTAAHALGEKCLTTNTEPSDYIGQKFGEFKHKSGKVEEFIADGDMVEDVTVYVDYCRSISDRVECTKDSSKFVLVEQKVELPFIGEGEKGTADFISLELLRGTLHVVDYKNGFGLVDEFENVQGLCYGLGAANLFQALDWDRLRITIVQPNAYHHAGSVRSWDVPRTELLDWKMDFAEAGQKTLDPNAPLIPGKHCGWCKARFICRARNLKHEETLQMDFTDPNSRPVKQELLTDAEIIDIVFNKIPDIKKWCANLEDYAQKRAEEKNPLPGSKLVETRQVRMWRDVEEAEKVFRDVKGAYESKFKSAPQMEKLMGKKKFGEFEHLVKKTSTGVVVVPADDPRPSARASGESEFGAVSVGLFD